MLPSIGNTLTTCIPPRLTGGNMPLYILRLLGKKMCSSFNGYISATIEIFPYVCYMAVVGWVVGVWNWSFPFIASTDTRLRPFFIVLCFLIIARSVLRLPFFFLVCESLHNYFFCRHIVTVLTVKFTVFQCFYLSSPTAKHPPVSW